MFRTKTKTEQAADAVSSSAQSATEYAATLKERVAPAAEVARERASSGQGLEQAACRGSP